MVLYFSQIPAGANCCDYPPGTAFYLEDEPLKRHPVTFQLLPRIKRKLVYPEDCSSQNKKIEHMKSLHAVLDEYLYQLSQHQALLLRKDNGTNSEDILFLYRYLEKTRIMTEDAPDIYKALRVYRLRMVNDKVVSLMLKYGIHLDLPLI